MTFSIDSTSLPGSKPSTSIRHSLAWHNGSALLMPSSVQQVGFIYLAVQELLHNRPEILTETTREIPPSNKPLSKTKQKRLERNGVQQNKVKLVRVIRPKPGVSLTPKPKREFTRHNGSWGVLGHWRTLKSGKKIWVRPYRKGPERDNPNAFKPKTYQSKTD
ncbi:hypothetical protein FWD07_02230 [Candidatus Saccharibacteria bacterium]|nr:hypothetical protein [Candidatus Saccharibacteria bacterium]